MPRPMRLGRPAWVLAACFLALSALIGCYHFTPGVFRRAGPEDSLVFRGFYALEAGDGMTFRWSGQAGQVVLPQVGRPAFGVATLGVWFPTERPGFPVTITSRRQSLVVVQPQPGRRAVHVLVPRSVMATGDLRLDLLTTPWRPAQETRALGVALRYIDWQGGAWTFPPWRQLWVLPGLAIACALLLLQFRIQPADAWMVAGALSVGLAAAAALIPLRVAPFTHRILLAVLLAHVARILWAVLPRVLPRTLPWLAALQFCGYAGVWAILHVARAAPAFDNGWFTPGSRYVTVVEALPVVSWLLDHPSVTRTCFLVIIVLLSGLYFWTLHCIPDHKVPPTRTIIALTLGAALPLLFLPRLLSLDVYSYALYGRVAAVYGQNPFITRPDQFPQDPLFFYIAWTTTPSVYGPAMVNISLPLTWLAQGLGGSPGTYVLVYKLAAVVAYAASIVVVKRLLDVLYPQRMLWGTIAYAWHPLVMIEFVGSGHNDSLMMLLVLFALLLAVRERRLLAVLVLVVAGMVKLVALALIPLYAMYTLRTTSSGRLWLAVRQVAVASGVVVLLYAPYWVGPQTLEVLSTAPPLRVMRGGMPAWAWFKLSERYCTVAQPAGQPQTEGQQLSEPCVQDLRDQIRSVSLVGFFVIYAALVLWPIKSFGSLLDRSVWVLVAYTLLAAISFRSWYVTWVVALVPLMRQPRLLLLLWGCTIFLDYSRLPIWERNLLGFVPVLVLLGQMLLRPPNRWSARIAGRGHPTEEEPLSA